MGEPELTEEQRREEVRKHEEWESFCADPWWAIEQSYVLTEDEHAKDGENSTKPFPTKRYLREVVTMYQVGSVGMVMKSRQLMMSWTFCWLLLHEAITKSGRLCVAQGKREEDVLAKGTKALMGRMRFMRRHLPDHLQPNVIEESKSTEVYDNGSTIMAIPQGEDVIRSLTASVVFMDELSRHPLGELAWTAALPTVRGGGKLWGVSTPNGREFCYRQADDRLPWDAWEQWPQLMDGLYGYKNTKGMYLVALHYTADEDKRTAEYQKEARKGYTNVNFYRQENELDFSLQPGEAVFGNEFSEQKHCMKAVYKVNKFMPVYRGWDFGYNGQACSFLQHNHRGQLIWFDQVFYKRLALPLVCQEVNRRMLDYTTERKNDEGTEVVEQQLTDLEGQVIEGARIAKMTRQISPVMSFDYGDPSGEAHNTKGETDRSTLLQHGFMLRTKPTTGRKRDIVENVRALMLDRSDGTPGILIARNNSPEMRLVVEGFKGGYHYPEVPMGRADKQIPAKDGFYDHIFDGMQYAIDHIRPIRPAIMSEFGEGGDWWKGSEWTDSPWAGDQNW